MPSHGRVFDEKLLTVTGEWFKLNLHKKHLHVHVRISLMKLTCNYSLDTLRYSVYVSVTWFFIQVSVYIVYWCGTGAFEVGCLF